MAKKKTAFEKELNKQVKVLKKYWMETAAAAALIVSIFVASAASASMAASNSFMVDFKHSAAKSADQMTVQNYFHSYNKEAFDVACDRLSDEKCEAAGNTAPEPFTLERFRQMKGYENVHFWMPETESKKYDSVVCVQYNYVYKDSATPRTVTETLSFHLSANEGGGYEITERVCEQKLVAGIGERPCPIQARRNYCVN